jgi:hypothetical protein
METCIEHCFRETPWERQPAPLEINAEEFIAVKGLRLWGTNLQIKNKKSRVERGRYNMKSHPKQIIWRLRLPTMKSSSGFDDESQTTLDF